MWTRIFLSIVAVWLWTTSLSVADDGSVVRYGFPRPRRKIIAYGWELGFREVSELRRRAEVMQRQPLDGILFSLFYQGKARDEAFIHSTRLTDEEMAPVAEQLAAIRWTRFTDNFLVVKAGERFLDQGEPSRLDWFDDRQWDAICHNIRVLTRVAVAARCVGLGFDPEPYHAAVWNYDQAGSRAPQLHRDTRSFGEYAAMVRRRGAQYLQAIQSEMPTVRIFNLYQAVRLPPSELAETIYSLYPAFINGMLDVAGPEVTLIDGNEYGFSLLQRSDYTDAYVNVKERKLALIDPQNRDTYRRQVQVSVPIYLDDIFGSYANRRWVGTYLSPEVKRRLFEHKLFHALDAVDEYVWVYGERPAWFGEPRLPRWAVTSLQSIKQQVDQLRIQARPEDTDLIARVRERMEVRDREVAGLSPAQRATPRVSRPQATIRRRSVTISPPQLDGRFDDRVWQQATALAEFQPLMYLIRDRRIVDTICRVMWDERFLYLGFDCREPRMVELKDVTESERRRNRTTIVLSESTAAQRFVRIDFSFQGQVGRLTRELGKAWVTQPDPPIEECRVVHRIDPGGWTAELRIAWTLLGGMPQPGDSRRATVSRLRSPWTEHDSWAPQIDPNLIDDALLGVWDFQP